MAGGLLAGTAPAMAADASGGTANAGAATVSGPTASGVTTSSAPAGYPVPGIDVSSHDHAYGPVNWQSVAASGVKFAYIKATEGEFYVNPYFASDNSAAKAAGVLAGAYAFARPDLGDPVGQADYFINHAAWRKDWQTLVPFVDLEWPYSSLNLTSCYGLSPAALVAWIHGFVDRIQARIGRPPMIYTNSHWWNPCTANNTSFGYAPLDIASYTSTPPVLPAGWSSFTLWQYAAGSAASGTFDRDVFNGSAVTLSRLAGGPAPIVPQPAGAQAVMTETGPKFFGRGSDNALWWWGSGSAGRSLGGSLVGRAVAVRVDDGTVYVFGRSAAGRLSLWSEVNGVWSVRDLGGSLAGDPVINPVTRTAPYVFGRGADGALWQWYLYAGSWYARSLGGVLVGDPDVAGAPDTIPWVFAATPAHTLQQWYYTAAWHNLALGGSLAGNPTSNAVVGSVPYVFGRGTNNSVWQWYYYRGVWYSRSLGGVIAGDPRPAGAPDAVPWVFAAGTGRTLQQWYYTDSWHVRSLGGSIAGNPVVNTTAATVPYVFARAADNTLWQWYYYGGVWYNRTVHGSVTDIPAVAAAPDTVPALYARNAANTLQRWYYTDAWHTEALAGALAS